MSLVAIDIFRTVFVLFMALVFHEFAHAYVALKLGDATAKEAGRLTLNPIKHTDFFLTILLPIILIFLSQSFFN